MIYQHRPFPAALALLALTAFPLCAQTPPQILVGATSLSFKTGAGQNPDVQSVFVGSSSGALTLSATVSTTTGGNWLQYSFDSGTTPANLKVIPQTSDLQPGTYQGQIQIASTVAANSPLAINVTVTVGAITVASPITASPSVLNFTAQLNGNPPPAQLVTLGPGDTTVGYTVNVSTGTTSTQWLQVTPLSGNTPQLLTVTVNTQGLTGGTYTGTINVVPKAQGAGTVSVVVNLSVTSLPSVNLTPQNGFQFFFQTGTTAVPAAQGLTLSASSGTLTMGLQATTSNGLPWLTFGQSVAIVGATPIQIPIGISPVVAGFQPGTYSGALVITAPGATNPSIAIPITLQVSALPLMTLGNTPTTFNFRGGFAPPPPQPIQIGVSSGQLPYTLSTSLPPGQNWLSVTPDTGILPVSLNVAVDATGLTSGTYSGTVRIDAPGSANSPLTFPITLSVSANGLILISQTDVSFNFQIGMAAPTPQPLNIGTTGGTAKFNIQTLTNNCGPSWLSVSPTTGTAPTTVNVSVNTAGMATPGLCTARVGIVNSNGIQTLIPVNLNISGDPLLNVTPRLMTFSAAASGAAPPTQAIQLAGTDPNNQIFYSALVTTTNGGNWLTIATNSTGQTPVTMQMVVNHSTLGPGTYTGQVEIRPTGLSPVRIPVTLTVTSNISLGVSPPSISFATPAGINPGPQILSLSSVGGAVPFSVNALSSLNWLSATPGSGTTPAQLVVSATAAGLAPGTYDGSIIVSSNQTSNPAVTVPVSLAVGPSLSLTVAPTTIAFTSVIGDPAPPDQTITLSPSSGTVTFKANVQVTGSTQWLKIMPASGTAPASGITVSVDPTNLAPALYSGTITITPVGLPQIVITVSYNIAGPPVPLITSAINAASLLDGAVAPGEILVVKGANTGAPGEATLTQPNSDGTLPVAIGDTQVLFDTFYAPILAVRNNQVTVVVPYEIAGQASTLVQVKRKGVYSNLLQLPVTPVAPAVFTSNVPATGIGVILNPDGTPNSATNPAVAAAVLTVYYTGDGQTDPPLVTNSVNPSAGTMPSPLLRVTSTIGGVDAVVTTYGPAAGLFAGLSKATIAVPAGLGPGAQPLFLLCDTTATQPGVFVYVTN